MNSLLSFFTILDFIIMLMICPDITVINIAVESLRLSTQLCHCQSQSLSFLALGENHSFPQIFVVAVARGFNA